MEAWLGVGFLPVDEMVATAVAAEQAGFAGVHVADHLVWPARIESAYPYSPGGQVIWPEQTDWPDAWVAAGAVLQATTTLRFATNVFVPTLRDPHVVAKAVSTAAVLSKGRVVLGVGAGWLEEEFAALERPFAGRGRDLDETLALLRELWSGELVMRTEAQRSVGGVRMLPAPGPVPVWVGGHSERALRRAVANDGWIGVLGKDPDAVIALVKQVRRQRSETSGDDTGFTVTVTGYTEDLDLLQRLSDAGVDGVLVPPLKLARLPLDERRTEIARYADAVLSRLG